MQRLDLSSSAATADRALRELIQDAPLPRQRGALA